MLKSLRSARFVAGRESAIATDQDLTVLRPHIDRMSFMQRIEAPVRDNNSADQNYAYGGKDIGDRQSDVDRLLVDKDQPEEQRFLNTAVAFPDALRFKGAAPEIVNSRYSS